MLKRATAAGVVTACFLVFSTVAQAAEVRVLASNGVKAGIEALRLLFEQTTGNSLWVDYSTAATMKQRIEEGEIFDVAILTDDVVDALIKSGSLTSSMRTELARVGIGVGFRKGAAKPDVRTVASLKQALLRAKSIAYTVNGASRPAIDKMIAQLGIARELEPKAHLTGAGEAPASVGTGQSELVLTLISEILPEPGVELAGPLPAEFQSSLGFSAALWAKGSDFQPAQAFIAFLKGADAAAVFKDKGLNALTTGATEPLTYDHMHLAFADTAAATAWYIRYLGALARPDGTDGVFFGPIRFNMQKTERPAPSSGSVIDAIGLSYANLDERMKALEGSRAKILQGPRDVPGLFRMAVIEDPWGTKIELVQDRQLLGFHHVRVRATDPAAMQKWFADVLGGEPAKIGSADALKFGSLWLIVDKADAPPTASEGTVINHLGFRTRDIRSEVTALRAKGVRATGEPRQDASVLTTFATFIEGATGRIELTQR